jgi:hypothetical protein
MSRTLFNLYTDIALREWSRNCKLMGLKTGKDHHVHNLLFTNDQAVIIQRLQDANSTGRKNNNNMRNGV